MIFNYNVIDSIGALLDRRQTKNVSVLVLFFSLFIFDTAVAQVDKKDPKKISVEQKQELKTWGNRHRDHLGNVLNPPLGTVDDEVRSLESLVLDIVDRLAGDQLKNKNIQLVIGIYADDAPNAFMAKMTWDPKLPPKQKSIVMQLKGFNRKKPVYELGISLGLIRLLTTKDELAFVLAHELSHLFENHLGAGPNNGGAKMWWDSQQFEAIADHKAIEMMLGKYDILAALDVLEKLALEFQKKSRSKYVALENFIASHHHEGVRIGMAQAFIEFLRRTNTLSQPIDRNNLPPELQFYRQARKDFQGNNDFEAFRPAVDQFINEIILKHVSYVPVELDSAHYLDRFETSQDLKKRPTPEVRDAIFQYGIEQIEKANLNGQKLGDSVLTFIMYFQSRFFHNSDPGRKAFSDSQKFAIWRLLLAAAHKNWQADKYFKWIKSAKLDNTPEFYEGGPYELLYRFIGLSFNQEIFHKLIRVNSEWTHFTDQIIRKLFYDGNGQFSFETSFTYLMFNRKLISVRDTGPWILRPYIADRMLEFIQSDEFISNIQSGLKNRDPKAVDFIGGIYWWRGQDLDAQGQQIFTRLRQALNPVEQFYIQERRFLIADISSGKIDLKSANAFYDALFMKKYFPWTQDDQLQLPKAIANLAQFYINQKFPLNIESGVVESIEELIAAANSKTLTKAEKAHVLKFVATLKSAATSFSDREENGTLIKSIERALNEFSTPEIYELLSSKSASIESEIQELFYSQKALVDKARAIELKKQMDELAQIGTPEAKSKRQSYIKELRRIQDRNSLIDRLHLSDFFRSSYFSILSMIGSSPNLSQRMARESTLEDFQKLLATIKLNNKRYVELQEASSLTNGMRYEAEGYIISADAGLFLWDLFRLHQKSFKSLASWVRVFSQISKYNQTAIERRSEFKDAFENHFKEISKNEPIEKIFQIVSKEIFLKTFSAQMIADVAVKFTQSLVSLHAPAGEKAKVIAAIEKKLQMHSKFPELLDVYRENLAVQFKVQPAEVNILFPTDQRKINTKSTSEFSSHVRGLSAFVAMARPESVSQQLMLIDYLMGRSQVIPAFVNKAARSLEEYVPFEDMLRNAQIILASETELKRAFIANMFLAGPNSIVDRPIDRIEVLKHLLKDISPENKEIAFELAEALLVSQRSLKSMSLAYMFGQRSKVNGQKLSEGDIVRSLFEAFGAAGIKLGQYLAFTSEMQGYAKHLSQLQDSAMPISYLAAVKLIQQRIGQFWIENYQVVGILGTGSVNVAVEYIDQSTGKKESKVVSILRSDIEIAANEDFRKLEAFVLELVRREAHLPQNKQKYSHLPGLLKVIKESVFLEFDKQNAFRMQNKAYEIYARLSNGWQVQSVRGNWVVDGAFSMDKAPGRSAVKVREDQPKIYQQALRQLLKAEIDLLFGVGSDGNAAPISLIANPDFHDGQVLIDEENQKVTIIDFGQAIDISNAERILALKVLRLISGHESSRMMKQLLAEISNTVVPGHNIQFSDQEITQINNKKDRMEKFVYLLGLIGQKNMKLPLSSVHWVLGVNRAVKLGEIIGYPVDKEIIGLVLGDKVGFSLETVNKIRSVAEKLIDFSQFLSDQTDQLKNRIVPACPAPGACREANAIRCEALFN